LSNQNVYCRNLKVHERKNANYLLTGSSYVCVFWEEFVEVMLIDR